MSQIENQPKEESGAFALPDKYLDRFLAWRRERFPDGKMRWEESDEKIRGMFLEELKKELPTEEEK